MSLQVARGQELRLLLPIREGTHLLKSAPTSFYDLLEASSNEDGNKASSRK